MSDEDPVCHCTPAGGSRAGLDGLEFEVRGSSPDVDLAEGLGRAEAVSESVHVPEGKTLQQVWNVSGPTEDLEAVERLLETGVEPAPVETRVLESKPRSRRVATVWRRPIPSDGDGLGALLARLAWARVLVQVRLDGEGLVVRALDEEPDNLEDLFEDVVDRFGETHEIDRVRSGTLDGDLSGTVPVAGPKVMEVMNAALRMGYYEEPKGCSARELAEEVGMAPSTVSRKLRTMERAGLQALLGEDNLFGDGQAPIDEGQPRCSAHVPENSN